MQIVLFKDEVIAKAKQADIKCRISSATGRIAEGVQRHQFLKRRVKKIYPLQDRFPDKMVHFFHSANIIKAPDL